MSIYVLSGISLLFIIIGLIVTENNAKHLLAGYNTMSEKEREQVDLKKYLFLFRRFHFFLGVSYFVFGCLISTLNNDLFEIFLGMYPIITYIFWMHRSSSLLGEEKSNQAEIYILVCVLTCIITILSVKS